MRVPNLSESPYITPPTGCACCRPKLTRSRVTVRPAPARVGGPISLGSLTSALVLAGLIGGLGYGAHALLQDLQRAGFAPLPLAPEIFASAPRLTPPHVDSTRARDPGLPAYGWAWDGIPLAVAPAALPGRDGPISDIDPETAGVYAPRHAGVGRAAQSPSSGVRIPDGPNGGMRITLSPDEAALAEPTLATAREAAPPKVVLHATDKTWIRVRDGEAVIFEGILQPGDQYEVPDRARAPLLRTGNAGALFALLDGTNYGPVGSSSVVLKNMSLRAADLSGRLTEATPTAIRPGFGGDILRQAEASLGQ